MKSLQRIRAGLRRARESDPTAFWLRSALVTLCVACVLRVVFGEDPWTGGVAGRLAEGAKPRAVDYVATWGWWTAAGNAVALLALLLTLPRWLDRRAAPTVDAFAPGRPGRAVGVLVAAAVVVGGVLAAPRLGQSLFEDEVESVRWRIDGYWYSDADGELRFHEPTWTDTLWEYETPNNHVTHSILAKLSLGAWRLAAQPDARMVSETALRVPAFLAGLASIAAVALLGAALGHPAAGVAAAWLLALHPWHMRYASEARGYTLAMLLASLVPWLLLRCLHRGSWRRWTTYGAAQFGILWTYPATLWFVALLNLALLATLFTTHRGSPELRSQLTRWAVVSAAGAMLLVHLMAPNMAQFRVYSTLQSADEMDRLWFQDTGAFLATGMPWGRAAPNHRHTELSDLVRGQPELVWGGLAAMAGLAAIGAARWLATGGLRRRLVWVLLLPVPIAIAFGLRSTAPTHPQYLIIVLPGLALLWGLGLETLGRPLGRRGTALLAAVALGCFAAGTHSMRSVLRERPIQPWRDSVLATRPNLDPLAPENQDFITTSFYFPPVYYDPLLKRMSEPEHLEQWMRHARESGKHLYVNIGRPRLAERRHPELMALVEEHFEEVATFDGILSRGRRQVHRYRGGPEPR